MDTIGVLYRGLRLFVSCSSNRARDVTPTPAHRLATARFFLAGELG
jgi:hypothetical protein